MTPSNLAKICQVLVDAGYNDSVQAEHDIIYLAPPGSLNEEAGAKLLAAGAYYDESEYGWHVYT